MIVVLGSRNDVIGRDLVDRWRGLDAALLTSEDLSRPGWRFHLPFSSHSTAVVAGHVVAVAEISAVLVRWPGIFPEELVEIVPPDRPYVASEMTAFLVSWLTALSCPVLNRPTATCLMGPSWRPEQWVHAAARLCIPVREIHRHVSRSSVGMGYSDALENEPVTVVVIGGRSVNPGHPVLAEYAHRLAKLAAVDLLAVHFSGSGEDAVLIGADLWPELRSGEVSDVLLAHILDRSIENSSDALRK